MEPWNRVSTNDLAFYRDQLRRQIPESEAELVEMRESEREMTEELATRGIK